MQLRNFHPLVLYIQLHFLPGIQLLPLMAGQALAVRAIAFSRGAKIPQDLLLLLL